MTDRAIRDTSTFPFPRPSPFTLPPQHARLLAHQPVARAPMRGGGSAWLVAGYHDARRVLSDARLSTDRRRDGFPRFAPATPEQLRDSFRVFRPPLNWMDPPEHTAARRSIVTEFTARRVRALRPRIQRIVDDCLAAMRAQTRPADLVRALALPVPSRVICEVLGLSYTDHDFFEERTARMLSPSQPAEDRAQATREVRSFLDAVVAVKERAPTDDLLGRLIARGGRGGADHESIVSMAFVLLVAGHATTAHMISLGTFTLLAHPEQLALIIADSRKTPFAVEELLRYLSIVQAATARAALADIEVGGVSIRAGEGVVALGLAANRDPAVFDRPDDFIIDRTSAPHLAFGVGRHQCPGQTLARMELQIVFDSLFRRLPGLRVAVPTDELSFRADANIYGVDALPVTW